jgi:hypothetical protein
MAYAIAEMPAGEFLIDFDERGGVTTDRFVEMAQAEHSARVAELDDKGVDVAFDVVQSSSDPVGRLKRGERVDPIELAHDKANTSYSTELVRYGERVDTTTKHLVFPSDQAAVEYIEAQDRPLLPIQPGQTLTGSQDMAEAVRFFDPDNTSGKTQLVPATAEAMKIVAEQMVGVPVSEWAKEGYIVGYVGYGKRTTKPLHESILAQAGVQIGVRIDGRDQIDRIDDYTDELQACHIIFSAVPRACVLQERHVSEGTSVIDVGQGPHPESNEPTGSADEGVLAIDGVCATLLRHSVGRVTTYVVYDRVIGAYEAAHDTGAHLL